MTVATREEVMDAEIVRTSSEWAEVIKGDLGRAVEGIVSAGRNLIAAKADVAHGEWLPMLKEIGIGEDMAGRLMRIGRNEALSNSASLRNLPTATMALYELSRMDPSDIEHGIETGAITPKMTIKQAREYAQPEPPANVNTTTGEIHDAPAPAEPARPSTHYTFECQTCNREVSEEHLNHTPHGDMCDDCHNPYTTARKQELTRWDALSDLYTGMAKSIQTLAGYGGYTDIPKLMSEYEPDMLKPTELKEQFAGEALVAARAFIDELIRLENNHAGRTLNTV